MKLHRRPEILVISVMLGLLAVGACSNREQSRATPSSSERIKVGRLTTHLEALDGDGGRLDLGVDFEKLIRDRLAKSKSIEVAKSSGSAPGKRPGAKLRVTARLLPDGFTKELHAVVSVRVTKTGSIPIVADVDAVRKGAEKGKTLSKAAYVAHLEKALDEALGAVDQQAELLTSGNEALIKALESSEADIRIAAARALAERRAEDAVEPLCAVLAREQGQVGQAALGALTTLNDQDAVPCIIQWAGSEDRRVVLIIEPLATLGGSEALAYLEMIASGHEDARIRRAAEEGIRRIQGEGPSHED